MIGWINLSVEAFICDSFGRDAWLQIIKQAHVDCNWVSSCPYPDKVTYDLVITGAGILGVTVPQALEAYGQYFVNYVIKQGYTRLLRSLGSNIAEFLANLNNLHLHLTMGFPSMVAPAFRVEQVTSTSLLLHYHSIRPALWPIVSGVLKGASKVLFELEVEVELVASREAGDCDHEIFRVQYPHQESLVHWDDHGAALASSYSMTKEFFYELFPFHVILDRDCRVVQCGRVMARLFGKTVTHGSPVTDTFKLRHPYIPFEYDRMVLEKDSLFLLKSLETGLEFKGQMVQTNMPDGLAVLLFLGSPRVANLEEMSVHGIYLSDVPLHDMSRDFVLLAEQRQAEADLKERFEKMAVDLRVANDRLEQATRWLEEERQRSDLLLYRMLPADIAADLREGRKVEAISYPEVTILFSDMVGFTTTSAKSTPEEVYNMLNAMYDNFDGIVDDFPDVYKLETIGDAYFLVCNLTTECEKHVDVVIDFAIRMQAAARRVKNAQGEPVQIRIGIHTGPVVGGVLGAKTPRFSIYGDTVNVASRMESHGLPGKIHISDASYKRIVDKDKYAVRERGNIAVKGRGNMTTYLIGGTNDDWLLRHTSFDSAMDVGSGQLRDGSFVVTQSGRSTESLAPKGNTGVMEIIREGDEGHFATRSENNNNSIIATSITARGSSSGIIRDNPPRDGSVRDGSVCRDGGGGGGAAATSRYTAVLAARGSNQGSSAVQSQLSRNNSSSQLFAMARGSADNVAASGIPSGGGGSPAVTAAAAGIEAFAGPQAAAAAAAAVTSASTGAAAAGPSPHLAALGTSGSSSFREPPVLTRDGSLREAAAPLGGPPSALHRDTSFRAVYARSGRQPNPGSPLVSNSRLPLTGGSSLHNMAAMGSAGGGNATTGHNSDAEAAASSGSYSLMATTDGAAGGGGGKTPYEPSPLSRPEPSAFSHPTGIVLARSATSKASPLAPSGASQSGMAPSPLQPSAAAAAIGAASVVASTGLPSAPSSPALGRGGAASSPYAAAAAAVAAGKAAAAQPPALQQLKDQESMRRGSAPGSFIVGPDSPSDSAAVSTAAAAAAPAAGPQTSPAPPPSPPLPAVPAEKPASKSKGLAKKIKSLFRK